MKRLASENSDEETFDTDGETVIDGNFEDITDLQKDIDIEMSEIFQEFGGDENDVEFRIYVRKVIPNKAETEHCFICTPSELPVLDRIKNEYGPGTYKITINKNGKYFKRRKINIAKQILKEVKEDNKNISGIFNNALVNQQQQTDRYETLLLTLINKDTPNTPPPVDPMAMMVSMMGVMMQMKDFMTPANSGNNFSELLENVKLIQEITDGGSGGETNLLDLAKSFGPGLIEATNKLAENKPVQAPLQTPVPSKVEPNEHAEKMNMFSMQLNMLVNKASQNKDPALYADLIMDSISEIEIKSFLEMDDVIGYLASINPHVNSFIPWFTKLIEEINAALMSDEEEPIVEEQNEEEFIELNNADEINEVNEIPKTS
ncbi:MAG: hypothetical protein ABW148_18625 [Sedimenticola sp.]